MNSSSFAYEFPIDTGTVIMLHQQQTNDKPKTHLFSVCSASYISTTPKGTIPLLVPCSFARFLQLPFNGTEKQQMFTLNSQNPTFENDAFVFTLKLNNMLKISTCSPGWKITYSTPSKTDCNFNVENL